MERYLRAIQVLGTWGEDANLDDNSVKMMVEKDKNEQTANGILESYMASDCIHVTEMKMQKVWEPGCRPCAQ